jgi:aminobenzoyl-glutamate utilization protein B
MFRNALLALMTLGLAFSLTAAEREDDIKDAAAAQVGEMSKLTQVMVDKIFSFGELGFQEVETSRYLVALLREHGFTVEEGIAGIPTAWMASWGSGKPVIAFGSDIDGIPKASQKPGVAYHDPLVEGAPGHGEGHNSGQAVNVTAAIVLKRIMEREGIQGTLRLWPGVAEELVASKAWFIRAGYFKDVDVCIFTHVGNDLTTRWGTGSGNGLVSVEYTFRGESAHSAGAPWRGKTSDAAEPMNTAMNFPRSTEARSECTTSSRTAAISRTSCPPRRPSGTTSASSISPTSRSSTRSETRRRRPRGT